MKVPASSAVAAMPLHSSPKRAPVTVTVRSAVQAPLATLAKSTVLSLAVRYVDRTNVPNGSFIEPARAEAIEFGVTVAELVFLSASEGIVWVAVKALSILASATVPTLAGD